MKSTSLTLLTSVLIGAAGLATSSARAQISAQDASNVVGTGDKAWSYLIVEGEDYASEANDAPGVGFTRVDSSGSITNFLGNPVLGKNTTASKQGALFTQTTFGEHIDKVTYKVKFAKPGTYYLYMRFTMFENGGNLAHYINEDSFFVPPDFDKDPQTDWPLPRGGYAEGCCDGGFLTIKENGVLVPHRDGGEAGQAFWEGNFHWNLLQSSQFNNPATQGEPGVRFKYVVSADQVGKTMDFTISYREGGVTIDLFLFATNPNLMDEYTQADLDKLLIKPAADITVQDPGNVIGTGDKAWSYLVLEGEDYDVKANEDLTKGFIRVDNSGSVTNFLGNPVLGKNTTASKQGALFTQTPFGEHIDKVTYKVQFSRPGTYYLYMRFTMFENGGNLAHYINEDSFFVPPDFNKDPQTDWPLPRGGYAEGCCDGGFLTIKENGVLVPHRDGGEAGQAFWEGNFHWNQLSSSQFNNPATQGEPGVRFKYVVSADQIGKPMTFTISYREGGTTIDLFLFSTNPNLMDEYTQAQLDQLLVKPAADVTAQDPSNVIGTGDTAWSYLILEGEDYDEEANDAPGVGFTRVDSSGAITNFLGHPVLGPNTTASKKGALFTQTPFGEHIDKVTYKLQFARPGTYYLYMRFTMFENGGNLAHYINEDSFFVPPDFGKDPQTDWPLPRGGYAEGCCDGGYLTIKENGTLVPHRDGGEAGQAFWEGNFHWNLLQSSQFNNPATQGEPGVRFKYEVKASQVGVPLTFTVSYREGGTTIDLFLFSTNPNLMDQYSQADLDNLFINPARPSLAVSRSGKNAVLSWPTSATGYRLESTGSLAPAAWSSVGTSPVVSGDQNTVTVDASTGARYYRLTNKP